MSEEVISPVTPLRAGIYMRYSCDMQRPASLEDQDRNCRQVAATKGWKVIEEFVRGDAAMSGQTLKHRDGLDYLLARAQEIPRPFDILITDEMSRLSRTLKDTLGIAAILRFCGVKLYIVSHDLDSDRKDFDTLVNLLGTIAQENSKDTRHRVLRGQEGRIRNGFSPCGRCFGYKSEPIINVNHPELRGRAAISGYKWKVYEPEAATVRRIFHLFADGLSMSDIMRKLNGERVPAPGKSIKGLNRSIWHESSVKRILKNEDYIGVRSWMKTSQVIHPVTEKTVTRKNPPDKWVRTEIPEIRVIDDELWARVQGRLKIINEKMTCQRLGGLARAKNRDYLFSGLLECGRCGSPMNIWGGAHSYVCSSWRHGGECTNNLRIREERLTSQLIEALTKNLLVPEVMDYFINSVARDFESYVKGSPRDDGDSFEGLQNRKAELTRMAERIVEEMLKPVSASSEFLSKRLAELETEIAEVRSREKLLESPKNLDDAKVDIAAIVRSNISNLLEIIKQDAPKAREVLQRRIKKLRLFPTDTPDGPAYEVCGEIDLFSPPTGRKKGVLLACSGTRTGQQNTSEVDFIFRFKGVTLYPEVDIDPHPLIGPFAELLAADPGLLHQPKSAIEWTALLRPHIAPSSRLQDHFSERWMRQQLRDVEDQFVRHFEMTTIDYRHKTWYMFSTPGPTEQSDGECVVSPLSANMRPSAKAA